MEMTLFTPFLNAEKVFKCALPSLSSSADDHYLALSVRCDSDVDTCGSLTLYRGVKGMRVCVLGAVAILYSIKIGLRK